MQFKPLSFKGQLYESCTYIIPWNAYKNLNITAEETEAESGYWQTQNEGPPVFS